jgi:hypothetical protein
MIRTGQDSTICQADRTGHLGDRQEEDHQLSFISVVTIIISFFYHSFIIDIVTTVALLSFNDKNKKLGIVTYLDAEDTKEA